MCRSFQVRILLSMWSSHLPISWKQTQTDCNMFFVDQRKQFTMAFPCSLFSVMTYQNMAKITLREEIIYIDEIGLHQSATIENNCILHSKRVFAPYLAQWRKYATNQYLCYIKKS